MLEAAKNRPRADRYGSGRVAPRRDGRQEAVPVVSPDDVGVRVEQFADLGSDGVDDLARRSAPGYEGRYTSQCRLLGREALELPCGVRGRDRRSI